MLDELIKDYEAIFKEEIDIPIFYNLDDKEKVKILKMCIKELKKLYELDYFNDNYIEEVI